MHRSALGAGAEKFLLIRESKGYSTLPYILCFTCREKIRTQFLAQFMHGRTRWKKLK